MTGYFIDYSFVSGDTPSPEKSIYHKSHRFLHLLQLSKRVPFVGS